MSMTITPLSSSSAGNSVLVSVNGSNILIDCGIPVTRLRRGLEAAGVSLSSVKGILLTHEHDDHIRTVAAVSENYSIPVYAEERTMRAVKRRTGLKGGFYFTGTSAFSLAGMEIRPFLTPHDAVFPVGYSVNTAEGRFVLATDIGWFSPSVTEAMRGADIVMIESNHDVDMLLNGSYPKYLKQRILSQRGHLSNASCAEAVIKILDSGTRKFILGHLSEHNNTTTLALGTTVEALGKLGAEAGTDYEICVAPLKEAGKGITL